MSDSNDKNRMIKLKNVTDSLNKVGSGFCMAKWYHVSMHLHTGQNHSCYHPRPHRVTPEMVEKDPNTLHNSPYKKEQRKVMLEGGRPEECSYCWQVEDLSGDHISDRMLRSSEEWAISKISETSNFTGDEDVYPSYLELNFSNRCQFKCSYCSPMASSSILNETKKWGDWPLATDVNRGQYNINDMITVGNHFPDEETNPFIKAFWEWFPQAYPHVHTLRFTGGEPLLSPNVFKVLEYVSNNPKPDLRFAVNSNMSVPQRNIEKFITVTNDLVDNNKILGFSLFTSIDTWGVQAEWIRNGLDIEKFENNLHYFMQTAKTPFLSFMVTFCLLAIPRFTDFLDKILELRKQYNVEGDDRQRIKFDTPYTVEPPHLTARIADDWFIERLEHACQYLLARVDDNDINAFSTVEYEKLKRVLDWVKINRYTGQELIDHRKDFALFVDEHDRRRSTSFHTAFPELKNFYNKCREEKNEI
jgi:organic radical activating enzyme